MPFTRPQLDEITAGLKRIEDTLKFIGEPTDLVRKLLDLCKALVTHINGKTDYNGPVKMILFCPSCGDQHIDEPKGSWTNPPHRSHLCNNCGHIWRPADVPTTGVRSIMTFGLSDHATREPHKAGAIDPDTVESIWVKLADEGHTEAARFVGTTWLQELSKQNTKNKT